MEKNSEEIIELRGHHLGIVYDMMAIMEFDNVKSFDEAAFIYLKRGYDALYPVATIHNTKGIMYRIFFEKCFIKIVAGPDCICNSGCLRELQEEVVRTEISFDLFKLSVKAMKIGFCDNSKAKMDLKTLDIFNLKVGGIYPAEIIKETAEMLVIKTGAKMWQNLIMKWE